jgi:hypothetical protein
MANQDGYKYDGSEADNGRATDYFYHWSAYDLAEEVYASRVMANRLLELLSDRVGYTLEEITGETGIDYWPSWITR